MRGRNEVDVIAAPVLKRKHYFSKPGMAGLPSFAAMGDLPVLAEDTEQIAVREKNCPGTAAPYKRPFFTKMRPVGSDLKGMVGTANTLPPCHAVDSALARAESAVFHYLP